MITTFIADDQAMVRQGFGALLSAQPDISVVGEAANGRDAVRQVHSLAPDVVLMDVRMPEVNGLDAAREILARDTDTKVLMLTTFDIDDYVYAALRAGASGFLLKDARPEELLTAIRNVAAGDAVVAPSATRRLLQHVVPTLPTRGAGVPDARLSALTAREIEVLGEIAAGATNAEIGATLYMAEGTVKTHIGRLLAKLHIRDRVGLVLFAYETGLAQH